MGVLYSENFLKGKIQMFMDVNTRHNSCQHLAVTYLLTAWELLSMQGKHIREGSAPEADAANLKKID